MVASQAVMEHGPIRAIAEVSANMEAQAASGEWDKVEELAGKLRSAVMATAEKLSAIRRGRDATRAYATNE